MKYILIIGIIFGLSGCIPKMQNKKPSVMLKVLDKESSKPLTDVLSSVGIKSNVRGIIKIPVKKELGIALPASGVYVIGRRFSIGKKGYVPQLCQCSAITLNATCKSNTIKLNRSSSTDEVSVESLKKLVEYSKKRFHNAETVCMEYNANMLLF